MTAVRGHKQLHLPFLRQLTHKPLHVYMAEVVFRLFGQQRIRLFMLFTPAQRKFGFDEAMSALAAVVDGDAVFRDIKTGFKTGTQA
ncbi:hypothetical protein [Pantoea agglomerans]|uniref:hypothetical protein n=1 Tax=Enterobacter agglomerans TaxID=549 RepID=UPI0024130898|nr:hypothetical protein [Pantoea agglomerans]